MGHNVLDEQTADRLLSGVLAPEDAPPGYAQLATVLQAAHRPPTERELARCRETVAAMAGAVASSAPAPFVPARQRAGLSRLLRPRIAATLTAGALALFGGLANAGALPGTLQHAAHVILGSVGISVPDSGGGVVQAAAPTGTLTGIDQKSPPAPTGTHGAGGGRPGSGTSGSSVSTSHRGGHHTQTGGHHHGGPATHPQPGEGSSPAPDQASGPQGLCNAWSRGNGGENGNKLDATAFRRLRGVAEAHGQTVQEFCSGQSQPGHTGGTSSKKDDDTSSAHDSGRGDSSGHAGDGGGTHVGTAATSKGKARGHTRSPHEPHAGNAGG